MKTLNLSLEKTNKPISTRNMKKIPPMYTREKIFKNNDKENILQAGRKNPAFHLEGQRVRTRADLLGTRKVTRY